MPLFEKYWIKAIAPTAAIKCEVSQNLISAIDPKEIRMTHMVSEVEQTIIAELKAMVSGFRLMRNAEKRPSIAASRIPAIPP